MCDDCFTKFRKDGKMKCKSGFEKVWVVHNRFKPRNAKAAVAQMSTGSAATIEELLDGH